MEQTKNNSIEDKLIELSSKENSKEEPNSNQTKQVTNIKPLFEEVKDLTKNKEQDRPLTETDYLILTEYAQATPSEIICENYSVTQGYVNKLLRQSSSLDFLNKYKTNTETQMMIRGNAVIAKVWEKKLSHINNLLAEGKDSSAFYEMFGKLSFIEAQEKMSKINQEKDESDSNVVQNLVFNLTER